MLLNGLNGGDVLFENRPFGCYQDSNLSQLDWRSEHYLCARLTPPPAPVEAQHPPSPEKKGLKSVDVN